MLKKSKDSSNQIELLNDITLHILGNKNVKDISGTILATMKTHLNAYGGVIYFYDEKENSLYTYAFSQNYFINTTLAGIAKNWEKYRFNVDSTEQLLSKCFKNNKVYESKRLSDFYAGILKRKHVDMIQNILQVKLGIAVPIRINNKTSGVLFIAFKNKDCLKPREWSLVHFYTNLAGIAIDNHNKYIEVEQRYEMEKETTSILSHELKTPIAIAHHSAQTILMMLEKYKDTLDKNAITELLKTARDIQHGMDRLSKICNSIFNLREVENEVPVDVHLIDLKRQLSQILYVYERKATEKNLTFEYQLLESKQKYYGGIIQLEQIITILLDNAVKYTEKGSINLKIEFRRNKLTCTVTDTGCGIPKGKAHLVFGRFYRSQKNGLVKKTEGLGLGLYIAQKIMKEIKGTIHIHDNPKAKGTRFTAEIPVYTSRKIN